MEGEHSMYATPKVNRTVSSSQCNHLNKVKRNYSILNLSSYSPLRAGLFHLSTTVTVDFLWGWGLGYPVPVEAISAPGLYPHFMTVTLSSPNDDNQNVSRHLPQEQNPFPLPRCWESLPQGKMFKNVHCSNFCNSKNLEATCVCKWEWINCEIFTTELNFIKWMN